MDDTLSRFAVRTSWNLDLNALAQGAAERRRAGQSILDLTESNPTRCSFEYPEEAIVAALADRRAMQYDPQPRGIEGARRAIEAYYASQGVAVTDDRILLTSGSSEAYGHLFRLLADPGDNVLAPQPSYPLFEFLSRINDVEIAPYVLAYENGWEFDFGWLEAAVNARSRALIVVNPNNPTGSLIEPEERARIVEFCSRHCLALIADEVFLDYCFPEAAPLAASFAGTEPVLTFVLNGLSKTVALPQLKLGWIVASGPPEVVRDAMERLEVIADTYLSVGAPVQLALPRLLELRGPIQAQILARAAANLRRLDELLAEQSLCSRLGVAGGWSVVLRLPSVRTDEEWALAFLEEDGVLVHPGHFFNFAREGFVVASLIAREDVFEEGMRRLISRVSSVCGGGSGAC